MNLYRIFGEGILQNLSTHTTTTNVNSIFLKHCNGRPGEFVHKRGGEALNFHRPFLRLCFFPPAYHYLYKKRRTYLLSVTVSLDWWEFDFQSACWPFNHVKLGPVALLQASVAVLMEFLLFYVNAQTLQKWWRQATKCNLIFQFIPARLTHPYLQAYFPFI